MSLPIEIHFKTSSREPIIYIICINSNGKDIKILLQFICIGGKNPLIINIKKTFIF